MRMNRMLEVEALAFQHQLEKAVSWSYFYHSEVVPFKPPTLWFDTAFELFPSLLRASQTPAFRWGRPPPCYITTSVELGRHSIATTWKKRALQPN